MSDDFVTPIKALVDAHQRARTAATEALRALRNDSVNVDLREELSRTAARLASEESRLSSLLDQAEQAAARQRRPMFVAAMAAHDPLLDVMPPPKSLQVDAFPQPEDIGFDVELDADFDDELRIPSAVEIEIDTLEDLRIGRHSDFADGMPTAPDHVAFKTPPQGLDDDMKTPAMGFAPPFRRQPEPEPPKKTSGNWLDSMLQDYVDEDPFRDAQIVAQPRLRRYRCTDLKEVQVSGLLQRAPRSLPELSRLSNVSEDMLRPMLQSLVDRGLIILQR